MGQSCAEKRPQDLCSSPPAPHILRGKESHFEQETSTFSKTIRLVFIFFTSQIKSCEDWEFVVFDFGIQILPGIYVVRDRTIVRLKTTKIPKLHSAPKTTDYLWIRKYCNTQNYFCPPKKDPNGRNTTWLLDKLTLPPAWQTTKNAKGGLGLKTYKVSYLNNLRQN